MIWSPPNWPPSHSLFLVSGFGTMSTEHPRCGHIGKVIRQYSCPKDLQTCSPRFSVGRAVISPCPPPSEKHTKKSTAKPPSLSSQFKANFSQSRLRCLVPFHPAHMSGFWLFYSSFTHIWNTRVNLPMTRLCPSSKNSFSQATLASSSQKSRICCHVDPLSLPCLPLSHTQHSFDKLHPITKGHSFWATILKWPNPETI